MDLKTSKGETSDLIGVPGGGNASSNQVADIYQRLGGIERSIAYIERSKEDTDKRIGDLASKLEILIAQVSEAKGSFRTAKWIVGVVGGILTLICGFLCTIITMALKHYMKW